MDLAPRESGKAGGDGNQPPGAVGWSRCESAKAGVQITLQERSLKSDSLFLRGGGGGQDARKETATGDRLTSDSGLGLGGRRKDSGSAGGQQGTKPQFLSSGSEDAVGRPDHQGAALARPPADPRLHTRPHPPHTPNSRAHDRADTQKPGTAVGHR